MLNIINEIRKLNLPIGKYSVVGGGALASRGIRESDDVDLIVTEDLYKQLKNDGWEEKEKHPNHFHIYKDNAEAAKNFLHVEGCQLTTDGVIKNSDIIDGVPFMSLNDLIELKQTMGREKDLKDIELINNYLKSIKN
ncbi:MAG: hypothetical protein WCW14_04900 [Candidatus Paceibacterota bacterium]|jgi:hypothetical protein